MEKLKPLLLKVKQHHFWMLFVIAVPVLFYTWSAGTAKIKKDFKTNQGKIKSQFSAIDKQSKSRGGNHFPNEGWIESREELTNQLAADSAKAMEFVIVSQAEATSWPDGLEEESLQEIEDGRWNGKTVGDYSKCAEEEVERLGKTLNRVDSLDSPGLIWTDGYENLKTKSVNLDGEEECKRFQQELCIYRALTRAIRQTNEGASDQFDLPIFAIDGTAVLFEEVVGEIGEDEQDWELAFDKETQREEKKGTGKNARGKKNEQKRSPKGWKPLQMRESIESSFKSSQIDGYSVVPFRLKLRMKLSFLRSFLRSVANSPIPLVIEGMRLEHDPQLKPVELKVTSKGGRSGRTPRQTNKKQDTDPPKEKPDPYAGRGTLVEIWGFGYLVDKESQEKSADNDQSAQQKKNSLLITKKI